MVSDIKYANKSIYLAWKDTEQNILQNLTLAIHSNNQYQSLSGNLFLCRICYVSSNVLLFDFWFVL